MSIVFKRDCGKAYKVTDAMAGRRAPCKACGRMLTVPAAAARVSAFKMPSGSASASMPKPPQLAVAPESEPVEPDWLTSLVSDSTTVASNPAGVRFDIGKHLSSNTPSWMSLGFCVTSILAAIIVHPAFLLLSATALWVEVRDLLGKRAKFVVGDVNPAVIVSERPWRAAIYANLATGNREIRPALLILDAPLKKMTGGPPHLGMRLAAVCFYFGNINHDAWINLDATLLQLGTRNEADIQRVMSSIRPIDWQALDSYLARIPDHKPGMYKLWLGPKNVYMTGPAKWLLAAFLGVFMFSPLIAITTTLLKKPTAAGTSLQRSTSGSKGIIRAGSPARGKP